MMLQKKPVFADHEFLAYDRSNHIFLVTASAARKWVAAMLNTEVPEDAAQRLEWRLHGLPDMPFVLCVSGQRIYTGVFCDRLSSQSYLLPTIMSLDARVPAWSTNAIAFGIAFDVENMRTNVKQGQMLSDPRSDDRILSALRALGM